MCVYLFVIGLYMDVHTYVLVCELSILFFIVFELHSSQDRGVRVHFTSTGDKVYGEVPEGKGQIYYMCIYTLC